MLCEHWMHWSEVIKTAAEYEVEQWKNLCRKVITHNDKLYEERNDALTQYGEAEYKRKIADVKVDELEW